MRIGHGFDVHAFGGEGPIIIGGVRIPYEKGLRALRWRRGASCVDRCIAGARRWGYRQLFPEY